MGSTGRGPNCPLGDETLKSVLEANDQMRRVSCEYALSWMSLHTPVLEQSADSSLPRVEPMKTTLDATESVRIHTWHGAFGAPTPKGYQLWSPEPALLPSLTREKPKGLKTLTKRAAGGSITANKLMSGSEHYTRPFGQAITSVIVAMRKRRWLDRNGWLRGEVPVPADIDDLDHDDAQPFPYAQP